MHSEPEISPTSKVQHIWCSAAITKKMEDVFTAFINNQAQRGEDISEYVVYLATLGGSPFSAITLYNFIKAIPQNTIIFNMGVVASAGVPFYLGFHRRIGVPDCSFMIHQTTLPRDSLPEQFNVFDLDIQKASLLATDKKTQEIIRKETTGRGTSSLTSAAIKRAFLIAKTYTAAESLKYGFIENIEIPKLPETGVLYITDQYLATLPG